MTYNAGGATTNFPQGFANGISVRGVPILQCQPGQVYYVNNSPVLNPGQHGGSNSAHGTFLDPFATLAYALSQCVPGRGDIVMVGAGHAETISTATALTLSVSGAAVVGLGAGAQRPTFTLGTATTTTIPVTGSSISLQNCLFVGSFLSIASVFTSGPTSFTGVINGNLLTTSAVTGTIYPGALLAGTGVAGNSYVGAQQSGTTGGAGTYLIVGSQTTNVASTAMTTSPTDFAIDNCEFRDTSSVLGFLTIFTGSSTANAENRFSLTRSVWNSLSTVSPTVALTIGANQDGWSLLDNVMNSPITAVTQGPILMAAGAFSLTNFSCGRNRLQRPNTSNSIPCAISTSGTAWSGLAYDNYIGAVPTGTGIWINTGTKLSFINNYSQITGAADKSALINPSAV